MVYTYPGAKIITYITIKKPCLQANPYTISLIFDKTKCCKKVKMSARHKLNFQLPRDYINVAVAHKDD